MKKSISNHFIGCLISLALLTGFSFGGNVTETDNFTFTQPIVGTISNATRLNQRLEAELNVNTAESVPSLADTTPGSEGIRSIGALGGYTLEEYLEDNMTRGLARDYPTFIYSMYPTQDLNVSWADGDVYDPVNGYYHLNSGSATLPDNSTTYVYWSTNGNPLALKTASVRPTAESAIYVATFVTAFGSIIHAGFGIGVGDELLYEDVAFADLMPSMIKSGLTVEPTGTGLNNILQSSGVEYHNLADKITHASINFNVTSNLVIYCHTGGVWALIQTNKFPVGLWDNGTNLVAMAADKWYRGLFVSIANSGHLSYVAPDYAYTNDTTAIAGNDPDVPPSFTPYIPLLTAYVLKGDDAALRNDSTYWLDRRFMIRRGSITGGGGGSAGNVPTLNQVLLAGAGTGGILPSGMGNPSTSDQAANKGYVDSTINNINNNKAYVDSLGGDNNTAELESSIKPFKTIQKAIDTASTVAATNNRFSVHLSSGTYNENVSMSNYISVRGDDIESTIINGTVTYSKNYTDTVGGELSILTISQTNTPALILDAGDDFAYMGIRSCYFTVNYNNPYITNKSVVLVNRGLTELYATPYLELIDSTTNGGIGKAQIYEHTTDLENEGLSQLASFNASCSITSSDTNDDISLAYTHDNTDAKCINTMLGTILNIKIDDINNIHANNIKVVSHKNAQGRTLSFGTVTRLYMSQTNNCNVFFGYATGGTTDNVAIIRGNHIRMPSGSTSNIWLGAAVGVNDRLRVYDSVYIQNYSDYPYPKLYTNEGSAGKFFINTVTENGDHLFGSAIDISTVNSTTVGTPAVGHLKLYSSPYAGIENLYGKDSSGNIMRGWRDNFYNGYNDDTNAMRVGDPVYISSGLSSDNTPKIKRSIASDINTMPCIGLVAQVGGIATGRVGRIMIMGRLEAFVDTASFTSGQKLYVRADTYGVTNVAPTGLNVAQMVGTCHISSSNGYINVRPWAMDTLGGLTPSAFVTYTNPVFASISFMLTNGGNAKFSTADIPAGTTNTYILPDEGGVLATYTDIQLVPISAIVGESGGIAKGRVVYQSGTSGGKPIVKYADCGNNAGLPVIGVTTASGNLGDVIEVANFGPVKNINTAIFAPTEMIFLGTNGFLSKASNIPNDAMIMLGTCLESNAVTGSMLVNIRSYYMDGGFAGSMRYSVKNANSASNATANFFAINEEDEAMRMGIRSTNHFLGKGAYLVSGANGSMIFGNLRKVGYRWNIDMTDSGDVYTHNSWPMMVLVPQNTVASNSFLGIGTTNPLAMLDVAGMGRVLGNASNGTEVVNYQTMKAADDVITNNTRAGFLATTNSIVSGDLAGSNNVSSATNTLNIALTNKVTQGDLASSNYTALVAGQTTNAIAAGDLAGSNYVQTVAGQTTNTIIAGNLAGTNYVNAVALIITNTIHAGDLAGSNNVNQATNTLNISLTNRIIQGDLAGSNNVSSATNNLNIALTNKIGVLESRSNVWNTAYAWVDANSNFVAGMYLRTGVWNTAYIWVNENSNSISYLYSRSNAWNQSVVDSAASTNWINQRSNGVDYVLSRTSAWDAVNTSIRFKAALQANVTLDSGSNIYKFPMTNVLSSVGGSYVASSARWYPITTNKYITLHGQAYLQTVAANTFFRMYIYKNNSQLTTLGDIRSPNNSYNPCINWSYVDTDNTSTGDYYEVFVEITAGTEPTIGSFSNNWWAGEAK